MRVELKPLALAAMAVCGALTLPPGARAQAGADAPRAYTPVAATAPALYPHAAGPGAMPPRVSDAAIGAVEYRLNAAVAALTVTVEREALPADGQTPVEITVQLRDAQGQAPRGTVFVTIEASGGRVLLPKAATDEFGPRGLDADRVTPGVQLAVEGGQARFTLFAPHEPQDVLLRVTAGAAVAQGVIRYVPELREMLATGLVEGIVSLRRKGDSLLEPSRRGDGFEQEMTRWEREFSGGKAHAAARAAFFVKGVIRGQTLLTAAFDSDKAVRARLLRDVRPEEFYPVYGDSSLRGFDARSAERLYVRLDQGRSFLLYGDFETGAGFSARSGGGSTAALQQRALGQYNRSATGLRAHAESERGVVNAFAFRDSLRQVIEEFASQGSGPYGLANYAVLEGSAKVEMVVRDRNAPARILAATPLVFGVDYSFEPFSGRILLTQFLPSVDANLNPVSLRVSYEVDQGGQTFNVLGVDGQLRLSPRAEIGASLVDDANPLAAYRLGSVNATWRAGDKSLLVAEFARSTSEVNTNAANVATTPGLAAAIGEVNGDAWRIEGVHEGERATLRAFVGRSDPSFVNPSAPLQGGRGEAQARASYQLTPEAQVYAEGLRSEDRNLGGGTRKAGQLGAQLKASERLTLDLSLRAIRETDGTIQPAWPTPFASTTGLTGSVATGSAGGAVGFGNQLVDPVTGLVGIRPGASVPTTGGAANASALSSETLRLGASLRATDQLTVGGEIEGEIHGDSQQRIALGGDYRVAERTRLYTRYERRNGFTSPFALTTGTPAAADRQSDQFVFGIDTSYLQDTQLFSEYRLRDAASARDLQLASGMRNLWHVAEGIRATTAVESTRTYTQNAPDTFATAAGVDYFADPLWKGATRIEWRRAGDVGSTAASEAFDTLLWQASAARKLDRDWTALARNHLLRTDYEARGDVLQNRFQVGLAYRDTDTNRVNALGRYEYRTERDDSGTEPLRFASHLVSSHADWHPSRPWWLTGRLAALYRKDRFEGGINDNFKGVLASGRAVWDASEHWDLGAMTSVFAGQRGTRQSAFGLEAGYLLAQNLWLSAGYNFSGFQADRQLQGYEYTRAGVYLRLRFKFDEDLFRGDDKQVNRTLDR